MNINIILRAMELKKKLGIWLRKFLGLERFEFDRIVFDKEVIDNISELARQAHPKEFIAFLEGKARKKVMRIYGLAYQEYEASNNATWTKINFPVMANILGSIHSHPGPSNRPSNEDLHFFSKHGIIHLIIHYPYGQEDIQAYDMEGNKIIFEVVS
jgi:proteasome lid subunit RPN8/RPN11